MLNKGMRKNVFLAGGMFICLAVADITVGQSYDSNHEKPITYVCSFCGQQSSVPIQGAACGFGDGQNHNWMPVR
jgi:hypothetical protein